MVSGGDGRKHIDSRPNRFHNHNANHSGSNDCSANNGGADNRADHSIANMGADGLGRGVLLNL
jgi:hypothetical protein